ncbi:MAG TPA: nuclear transport factor 2 family protein [Terriglobales bacterium]|nr:nuclear transport factor 2 family protein [Terriglobales bacterium]
MTETTSEPASRPRDVYERLRRAVAGNDREAVADLMAEDGVIEWPFDRPGAPARLEGRQAIREYVTGSRLARLMRFEELRADAVHQTLDPEVIIVESTTIGRVIETGRTFELPAIAVFRIRDGEIVSYRDYVNPLAASEAVGASGR